MLDEFRELRVINRTRGLIRGNFTVSWEPQTATSPSHDANGHPIIYVKEPNDDERHIALGRFMDAWSTLEDGVATMLSDATGIDLGTVPTFMNALGMRGQLDVISVLGPAGLSDAQQKELAALLDRVKTKNTKRNHLVHGSWLLEYKLLNRKDSLVRVVTQYRVYEPSDPALRDAIKDQSNRKERDKYMFSIARIHTLIEEVNVLRKDVSKFNRVRRGLPEGAQQFRVEGQFQVGS